VRKGIGSDPRIGTHFLYPGAGFGGSCFPKDVKRCSASPTTRGASCAWSRPVEQANEAQKHLLGDKIKKRFGANLKGKRIALWGLAFKPNTDDMREAPSLTLIADLLKAGAQVRAYDPVAKPAIRNIVIARSAADALRAATRSPSSPSGPSSARPTSRG
jgi:UDPglucose 6-dehydrogenase